MVSKISKSCSRDIEKIYDLKNKLENSEKVLKENIKKLRVEVLDYLIKDKIFSKLEWVIIKGRRSFFNNHSIKMILQSNMLPKLIKSSIRNDIISIAHFNEKYQSIIYKKAFRVIFSLDKYNRNSSRIILDRFIKINFYKSIDCLNFIKEHDINIISAHNFKTSTDNSEKELQTIIENVLVLNKLK